MFGLIDASCIPPITKARHESPSQNRSRAGRILSHQNARLTHLKLLNQAFLFKLFYSKLFYFKLFYFKLFYLNFFIYYLSNKTDFAYIMAVIVFIIKKSFS